MKLGPEVYKAIENSLSLARERFDVRVTHEHYKALYSRLLECRS
jgi:hypothetical protein